MGRRIKQVGTTLVEVADNIAEQARQDAESGSLEPSELVELTASRIRGMNATLAAEAQRDYEERIAAERKAHTDEMTFSITRSSTDGKARTLTQRERAEKLIESVGEVLRVMRTDFELLAAVVDESQISKNHGGTGDDSIALARWSDLRALKVSLGHAYASLHHAQTSFKR